MFEDLVGLGDRLASLVGGMDPDAASGAAANQWWGQFDRIERLAAAGKTLLARRIADTHTPRFGEAKTAAEALAKRGGTSVGTARDAVETSKRLTELPGVEAAVRRGELSPAQAAAIADAAAANPAAQSRLLEQAARSSMPELREECLRAKAAADPDPEAPNARIHRNRFLRRFTDREGGWNLHARGTAQEGAVFNSVLDPIIDRLFHTARRDGRKEPNEAYAFDALIALADQAGGNGSATDSAGTATTGERANQAAHPPQATPTAAAHSATAGKPPTTPAAGGGEPGPGEPRQGEPGAGEPGQDGPAAAGEPGDARPSAAESGANDPPGTMNEPDGQGRGDGAGAEAPGSAEAGRRRVNPRFLSLLRVDLEALRRGQVAGQELCEISGVGPIPVARARELLGEAILHLVITRGVDVLNVTHLGRGPTAAQKIALSWISPICIVEGCYRRRVEYDHREPWAQTRHTRLDELDQLCEFHHDLRTHHGYALVAGKGKRPMVPPNDPRHPRHQKAPPPDIGRPPPRPGGRRAA